MSKKNITVETAPRDLEELKIVGAFRLKTLAVELGVFDGNDDEARASFQSSPLETRAELVLAKLEELDKSAGKAATKKAPKRNPSTKKAAAKKAEPDAEPDAEAEQAPTGAVAELVKVMASLDDKLTKVLDRLENLETSVEENRGMIAGQGQLTAAAATMSLMLGEEVLQAERNAMLADAFGECGDVEAALQAHLGEDGDDDSGEE